MSHLKSCHCCGLIQQTTLGVGAVCVRCETALESWLGRLTGNRLSAALSLAALVLFIPAVTLPFLRIEQLGQAHESSLLVGVRTLFVEGQMLVGLIVLLFSIILPILKLSALLFLSQRRWQLAERHQALTYRIVEHLGRWGMLDVLLVAVMVAFIKLGGLVEFDAGAGLVMFALFVLVSLSASATFDSHVLWDGGLMLANDKGAQASNPPATEKGSTESSGGSLPASIVPTAAKPPWRQYLIWLIPALTGVGVLWVVWDSFSDRGRLITVAFADGRGVEVGDELRYHGIVAGEVEAVSLTGDLSGVEIELRLTPESDNLAREGTRFWIVRPQADLTGIAGLETVVGSKYLTLIPGSSDGPLESRFVGLEQAPLPDLEFAGGIEVVLQSPQAIGLRPGVGVYYRAVRIGGVIKTGLARDGSAVETRVYIRPSFRHLIREKTVFWNAGGVHVVGGLTELSVHIGSVETLVRGGIGVSVPPSPGEEVTVGHRFELHDRPEKDWLKWNPSIVNVRVPTPPSLPRPANATLAWTHDGIVNRDRTKTGWVLPVRSGLLGPADLLLVPDDTIENSASLLVDGEAVELTGSVQSLNSTIVLRSATGVAASRRIARRPLSPPEDGFLVTGGDVEPLFIAATHYSPAENGAYRLEELLPINEQHHGAVIAAARDGAVIGCVTVDEEAALVWPVVESQ